MNGIRRQAIAPDDRENARNAVHLSRPLAQLDPILLGIVDAEKAARHVDDGEARLLHFAFHATPNGSNESS